MRVLGWLGLFVASVLVWSFSIQAVGCELVKETIDCVEYRWMYCPSDTEPVDIRWFADNVLGRSLGAGTGCADFGNGLQCYCCACNDTCGNAVVEQPQANNDNNGNNNNNGFTPIPPPPAYNVGNYFQTKGGSVMSLAGGVVSYLPTGAVFSKDGDNNSSPGIPMGNGASSFGSGMVSSTGWVAGSDAYPDGVISQKLSYRYDMERVKERIISSVKPSVLNIGDLASVNVLLQGEIAEDNARYLQYDGNLNIIDNLDLGDNKVIIIVNGDVNIQKNININDNTGYFAILASGNINVDPNVGGALVDPDTITPNLEGIYFAQKNFNTGTGGKQIRIDGAAMGMESVNLQRSGVSAWPSEYFVFRPDILMNTPKYMLRRNNIWQELAP